ncbi:MAG: hypothetical protein ACRC8Q_05720 [Aeromonas sp.]
MPRVVIDSIEYVPRAEIPPLDDDKLTEALKELVGLYYFGDWYKRGMLSSTYPPNWPSWYRTIRSLLTSACLHLMTVKGEAWQ